MGKYYEMRLYQWGHIFNTIMYNSLPVAANASRQVTLLLAPSQWASRAVRANSLQVIIQTVAGARLYRAWYQHYICRVEITTGKRYVICTICIMINLIL